MKKNRLGLFFLLGALALSGQASAQTFPDDQNAPEIPGVLINTFRGHTGKILGLAVSADGKILASSSLDKTVRLWFAEPGKEPIVLQNTNPVVCLAFSADHAQLAAGTSDQVNIWDIKTGKISTVLHTTGTVRQVFFASQDENIVAFSAGGCKIWNLKTSQETFLGQSGIVRGSISPDGKTLAMITSNGTITLINVATLKPTATFHEHGGKITALAFSPDGKTLATGDFAGGMTDTTEEKALRVWDMATGKQQQVFLGHRKGIYSLTYSLNGKLILAADYNGSMKLWDVEQGSVRATLEKVKIDDQLQGTPVGLWAISGDLHTWVASSDQEVLRFDITAFTHISAKP